MFHYYRIRFQVRITEKANLVKSVKNEEISPSDNEMCQNMKQAMVSNDGNYIHDINKLNVLVKTFSVKK